MRRLHSVAFLLLVLCLALGNANAAFAGKPCPPDPQVWAKIARVTESNTVAQKMWQVKGDQGKTLLIFAEACNTAMNDLGYSLQDTVAEYVSRVASDGQYNYWATKSGLSTAVGYVLAASNLEATKDEVLRRGYLTQKTIDNAVALNTKLQNLKQDKSASNMSSGKFESLVKGLVGKMPDVIFTISDFDTALKTMLKDRYGSFQEALGVSSEVSNPKHTGWYEGFGCAPHSCGEFESYYCINTDGKIYAAILEDDKVTWFGNDNDLPPPLQQWMREKGVDLK